MAKPAPKKKPQGASRNTGGGAPKKPAPGWLWMLLGIVMAAFVGFLLHLWSVKPGKLKQATAIEAPAENPDEQAPPATASQEHKDGKDKAADKLQAVNPGGSGTPPQEPRFDFYTILPNQKVMPNKATTEASTAAANKAAEQAAKAAQAAANKPEPLDAPTDAAPVPAAVDKTAYYLQAGSFKSETEADHRRANILILGLPVKVQPIRIKQGEEWFRVVVGPFKGKEALQSARASLKANGVDTLALKQG